MSTIAWQRCEGGLLAVIALAITVAMAPGWPIWVWPLLLLAPDLGMLAYLAGPRPGAAVYNALHLYAGGLAVALIGLVTADPRLIAGGMIWLAHVGADRALGYGLKEASGFRQTHLGRIGRGR